MADYMDTNLTKRKSAFYENAYIPETKICEISPFSVNKKRT
jgi:hypothetical protein